MKKIIAAHQPNYLPWLGFFYKMEKSDVFFLMDTAQYTKQSYANRAHVLGRDGNPIRLTVPVTKPHDRPYNESIVDYSENWTPKHLKTIKFNYSPAPFFKKYYGLLEEALMQKYGTLAELNIALIRLIRSELGIGTEIRVISELPFGDPLQGRNDRLIELCKYADGTHYLSGTGAMAYNSVELYKEHGLELIYSDFNHPVYYQPANPFVPYMSILDLMFNEGDRSLDILRNNAPVEVFV